VGTFTELHPSFPVPFQSLAASFDHVSDRVAEHSPLDREGVVGGDDDEASFRAGRHGSGALGVRVMRAGSFSLVLEAVPYLPDAEGCDERGKEDAAECGQEESHPEWHGPVGGEVGDLDRLRVLEDEDE
jgi:hypothetical protein